MLKSYKDLIAWQKAVELVTVVYKATAQFPKEEIYGLSQQMRRAAVSIPSNIAEGQHRKNVKEFLQFLRIAYGSGAELETQIVIARNLYKGIEFDRSNLLLDEVQKMLSGLIKKFESAN